MDSLEDSLLRRLSRNEIDVVVRNIAEHPQLMDDLLVVIRQDNSKQAWHAAWVAERFYEKKPALLSSHVVQSLTEILLITTSESVKRHLLSILRIADLPQELPVELINKAFEWLTAEKTAVAVKAQCAHYLLKVCKVEADLLPELKLNISYLLENNASPAIWSVAKRVFKEIRN